MHYRAHPARVCVENRIAVWDELSSLRAVLDRIAAAFKVPSTEKRARADARAAVSSIAITAKRPPRRKTVSRESIDHDFKAFAVVARMGKADLTDEEVETMWRAKREYEHALRDRARYRMAKARSARKIASGDVSHRLSHCRIRPADR